MDNMEGLEGLFRDPHGPAYQRRQERVGPPLEYVAEKLAQTSRDLHRVLRAERARSRHGAVSDSAGVAPFWDLRPAFMHALVAYLALGNLLALAADPGALVEQLAGYTSEEFEDWLGRIAQASSVTG